MLIINKDTMQEVFMKNIIFIAIYSLIIYLILTMPIKMAEVNGRSMNTTLEDGELLVIHTKKQPRINDIVSVKLEDGYVVKRLADLTEEGMYLLGDNAAVSYDSRYYGYVPLSNLDGVVIFHFKRDLQDLWERISHEFLPEL